MLPNKTPPRQPPPGLSLSLSPEAITAQIEAADKFLRLHRDRFALYGTPLNSAENEELLFAAGWNRALQWIWQHPDIYNASLKEGQS